jgi:hypothetical protein
MSKDHKTFGCFKCTTKVYIVHAAVDCTGSNFDCDCTLKLCAIIAITVTAVVTVYLPTTIVLHACRHITL